MKDHKRDVIEPENWVPWIGLALVVPALLIMLVFFVGGFIGVSGSGSTRLLTSRDYGAAGMMASLFVVAAAVGGLMLASVGLVRGLRRSAPHTGRSVGIAGFSLEIVTLVVGIAALVILGFAALG